MACPSSSPNACLHSAFQVCSGRRCGGCGRRWRDRRGSQEPPADCSAEEVTANPGAGGRGKPAGPQGQGQDVRGNTDTWLTVLLCDQVVDIMKTNVEKVLERDQKLSELDDRAGGCGNGVGNGRVARQRGAQGTAPLAACRQPGRQTRRTRARAWRRVCLPGTALDGRQNHNHYHHHQGIPGLDRPLFE